MFESRENRRDILILVGLLILMIALVVVADYRARSVQGFEIVGGTPGTAVQGQAGGDGSGGGGGQTTEGARWGRTLEFLKVVALITVVFILFIAIATTMIILAIRILQRRFSKGPPG